MAAAYLERMGARMRERREELGLTRPDVVRAMPGRTNENQLYRWEKGLHRPEDDALEAIAEVLQVSGPGWFFADAPAKDDTPDPFKSNGNGSGSTEDRLARIEEAVQGTYQLLQQASSARHQQQEEILERIEALEAAILHNGDVVADRAVNQVRSDLAKAAKARDEESAARFLEVAQEAAQELRAASETQVSARRTRAKTGSHRA